MPRHASAYDDDSEREWTGWPVPEEPAAPLRSVEPDPRGPGARAGRSALDLAWRSLGLLGLILAVAAVAWLVALRGGRSSSRVVPAVVGLPQPAAVARLRHAGFAVRAIELPVRGARSGRVVSEHPSGGARLRLGSTVTVHVAR